MKFKEAVSLWKYCNISEFQKQETASVEIATS
jgi:hypothetical protein